MELWSVAMEVDIEVDAEDRKLGLDGSDVVCIQLTAMVADPLEVIKHLETILNDYRCSVDLLVKGCFLGLFVGGPEVGFVNGAVDSHQYSAKVRRSREETQPGSMP